MVGMRVKVLYIATVCIVCLSQNSDNHIESVVCELISSCR